MAKKYDRVVKAVNEIFLQYNTKMTLRQVYYRLVAKLIIRNTRSEYKYLSAMLVKARENGDVNYRMFEDRVRKTIGGDHGWDDPKGFLDYMEETFKNSWKYLSLSMWKNQPVFIEVWVEKDALSRLVSDVTNEYNVRTCPSRGYSSFTYIKDAVNRLRNVKQPIKILYFGDFDPSGMDIERDLWTRLYKYGCSDLSVERIALTQDQIMEYNLPPMPAKKSDARYNKFVAETGAGDAVELDALEPPVLEKLVKEAIEDNIDFDLWEARKEQEKDEKERLRRKLEDVEIMFPDEEDEKSV